MIDLTLIILFMYLGYLIAELPVMHRISDYMADKLFAVVDDDKGRQRVEDYN